jgi:DNA-binding MurR/RpiR family transcriptional regulator
MPEPTPTTPLRDRIEALLDRLTASERKLATVLLADYPYAGLVPIQELARRTQISAPSVTRFVVKIGCSGYQDFQRQLIGALKARDLSPLQLKLTEAPPAGATLLGDYVRRVTALVAHMAEAVPHQPVEAAAALIGDPARAVHVLGGRVTDTVAQLLSVHLRQIRPDVFHLPTDPEGWPDAVLRMRRRDVLVLFDVRRYEPRLLDLAATVTRTRGTAIVLMTDGWVSPIARHATHVCAVPTDLQTPWDTHVCLVTLVEAIIVGVSGRDWAATRRRIAQIDAIRFGTAGADDDGTGG